MNPDNMSYRILTLLTILVAIPAFSAPERQRVAVYFGGAEADVANAVALDAEGSAYVAGSMTRSAGRKTAFVSKTKNDGTEILWTAYLDGTSANGIAVDARGGVWAAGDGFLTKLNGEDGRVERTVDAGMADAVAVDAAGAVYVAGNGFVAKYVGFEKAYSAKVAGLVRGIAVDGQGAAYIAFGTSLARLSADGAAFDYALDLGFSANAVTVDGAGAAYVAGAKATVAKIAPAGDAVLYQVALSGVLEQEAQAIALDGQGNLFVAGWTNSSDFARARGWHGERDGFLVKLNAAGEVVDTAFAGTAARDALRGVAVSANGDVFVAGFTEAAGLGDGPLAQLQGATDAVLLKFAANGNRNITQTTTTLAASPSGSSGVGQAVVLTATVSPAGATGKVTFYAGQNVIGVGTLSGTTATISTSLLPPGTRTLRAYYVGDVNFSASTSSGVSYTVNVTPALAFSSLGGTTTTLASGLSWGATGDFNGDGRADVAVTNAANNTLSILLSNGAGGFSHAAGSPITTGAAPNSVTVGDFNGDGKTDLAVANFTSNAIGIFLGNGTGGFTAGTSVTITGGPFIVTAADVNSDGNTDLLVANFASGTLATFLGNGAGGFTAAAGSPVTIGGQPASATIGDFNGDGKVDVAVSNFQNNNVAILLGDGAGGFTAAAGSPVATGAGAIGVETGDFNADGKADLAVANFTSGTVSILIGNGLGGFSASTPITTGGAPRELVLFDFNGDGKLDLAVVNNGVATISIYQGNGAGGFTAAGSPISVGSQPVSVVTGDFTGDGRLDLVVLNSNSGTVQTIPGVGAAPLVVGGTPPSPTATPQTITFTIRDSDGYANISRLYFLINPNSSSIPQNTCHGFYDRSDNNFYLYNDALSVLQGPLTGGSGGTLQNGQCILYGTGSGFVAGAGTDLQVNFRMGMQGLYASTTEKIYLWAVDAQNLGTGWVQTGSWVLGAAVGAQAPTVISGTPTNPTTSPQTFTFTARDNNGAADIDRVYFLVNTTATTPVNACHGFYDRASNGLYLYNNDYSVLQGPLTLGTASSLSNSQCSVSGLTSALVSGSGTDVVFNLGMSLLGNYATATQNIYIWVTDKGGLGTGWQQTGSWGNTAPPTPPTFVSGSPSTASGSPQTFTIVSSDVNGYNDINRVYFVVNTAPTVPVNSCHGMWDRATGAFYLYNDALTALQGPLAPGAASSLSNSQCSINGVGSAASGSGNNLTVTFNLSLSSAYGAGQQKLYTWTTDNAGTGTGWTLASTWNGSVGAAAPTLAAVSPSVSTVATQTFTLVGRDANGFSDVNRIYFQVHTSATVPASTCHGFYDRASNSVFLYDDSLSSLTAFTVGTSNTVQNSQCRINGSGTTATGSGTDVVLNLNITRLGSYATGVKNLFIFVTDNGGLGTGWQTAANWNL